MSSNGLPEHIPVFIQKCAIPAFWDELQNRGFHNTWFQILSPRQIYGKIITTQFDGKPAELHIRCLVNGSEKIQVIGEFEPKRLGNVVQHLSQHSYSAHEYIIEALEALNISYDVNDTNRNFYNSNRDQKFTKQRFKFFHWLFIGGMLTLPRGVIWRIYYELSNRIKKKSLFDDCN